MLLAFPGLTPMSLWDMWFVDFIQLATYVDTRSEAVG